MAFVVVGIMDGPIIRRGVSEVEFVYWTDIRHDELAVVDICPSLLMRLSLP